MVDKISGDGSIPARAALSLATSKLSNGKARVETPSAAQQSPSAQISPMAKQLAASPPVDSAKIASLKAAISEGRYPIDADRIAEAMIRSELPVPKA